ncbi:hypothetical protein [Streptomyces sp. NPDC088847]|uniref:hypothetical protein n=1 Tax=Streptomyces sp. NPDC088847 TaxID=3365909 RepID=UPI003827B8FC
MTAEQGTFDKIVLEILVNIAACFTTRMIAGLCTFLGRVTGLLLSARRARRTDVQAAEVAG